MISQSVEWQNRAPGGVRQAPRTIPKPSRKIGRILYVSAGQILSISVIGLVALFVTACGRSPQTSQSGSSGEWREFQGTWTAAGSRNILRLGADRRAAISTLTGSLLLAGPSRPGVGFRSEAIVFNDTSTGMVGRAVWTDEHGDQAFSELRGEGSAENIKINGTFVGGTGRYAGITGTYDSPGAF